MTAVILRKEKYLSHHFKALLTIIGSLLLILLLTTSSVLAQQADTEAPNWTVATVKNPLNQQEQCMLQSKTITISDGYGDSTITLLLDEQALVVVTTSPIDVSFNDLRLVVDDNEAIKTDQVFEEETVVFGSNNISAIIEQFKKGYDATVYLRFWPTWPTTQSFPSQFNLRGFTKAYERLGNCNVPS